MEKIADKTPIFQDISVKSVAKYALLPGVLPRLGRLAGAVSKFLFMFTTLFGAVGLIDRNHPCLRPENIGRYRFTDIVGLAASRVVFDKKHLPQTLMFFAIIGSIILMVAIFGIYISTIFLHVGTAHAQYFGQASGGASGYSPQQDWAFQFLNRIFGDKNEIGVDFWGSGASATMANQWYTGLLAGMLKHYSYALLIIAAFMVIYLLVITIAESARTGQPFGSRFDSVWAPIRLALAIGLLVPVSGNGYNGAQLIAFQVSEWGSNMATNIWFKAIADVKDQNYISVTVSDPGVRFIRDMFLMNVCVYGLGAAAQEADLNLTVNGQNAIDPTSVYATYYEATNDNGFYTRKYGISPNKTYCGSFTTPENVVKPTTYTSGTPYWPQFVADGYYRAAMRFMPDKNNPYTMIMLAKAIGQNYFCCKNKTVEQLAQEQGVADGSDMVRSWIIDYWDLAFGRDKTKSLSFLSAVSAQARKPFEQPYFPPSGGPAPGHQASMSAYNSWLMKSMVADEKHGWSSAGVFYLRLSNAMSVLDSVVQNPPVVDTLPSPLRNRKMTATGGGTGQTDAPWYCNLSGFAQWALTSVTNRLEEQCNEIKMNIAFGEMMSKADKWFQGAIIYDEHMYAALGGTALDKELAFPDQNSADNSGLASIMYPFQQRLYSSVKLDAYAVNPLGEVIRWGSTFMSIATVLYGLAIIFGFFGVGISNLAQSVATMLMIPGFVLAFVVPMLPFLYFMFGVVEWMISVIEAVIGMPLWALSFISLEGDALGKGMNGVKMLFEILLRPTILVMSLIVSVLIFTAAVKFFNDSMDAVGSAYGSTAQSSLSVLSAPWMGLGMIFMYMIGVYSLATSCFKLINIIPDKFGRWMDLPSGFGSDMKVGVSTVTGIIAGGGAGRLLDAGVSGARSVGGLFGGRGGGPGAGGGPGGGGPGAGGGGPGGPGGGGGPFSPPGSSSSYSTGRPTMPGGTGGGSSFYRGPAGGTGLAGRGPGGSGGGPSGGSTGGPAGRGGSTGGGSTSGGMSFSRGTSSAGFSGAGSTSNTSSNQSPPMNPGNGLPYNPGSGGSGSDES